MSSAGCQEVPSQGILLRPRSLAAEEPSLQIVPLSELAFCLKVRLDLSLA